MLKESMACTGCGACLNVCPTNAIFMEEKFGYGYPRIKKEKCIKCGLCSSVCMLEKNKNNRNQIHKFEFRMKGNEIIKSSSGGFCFSIADAFIKKKEGVVYAALYNCEKKAVEHMRLTKQKDIEKTRGSKYVKSIHFLVFKDIKHDLDSGKQVLFIGLPCETTGLINFLMKDYDNLFTVALLCGGAVSPCFYTKYIKEIEEHFGKKIESINFRNKKFGSKILCTSVKFDGGKEKILSNRLDYYISLEGSRFVRPSCHFCTFVPEAINSDFIVGDCFGGAIRGDGLSVIAMRKSKKASYLLSDLGLKTTENEKLMISSRAINNSQTQATVPSSEEYSLFSNLAKANLKKSVKKYIYSNYSTKQKIYRLLPYRIKAKIAK